MARFSFLKKFLFVLGFLFFSYQNLCSQSEYIQHRVFLLGNVVDIPASSEEVLFAQLAKSFDQYNTPFTLVLNGDLTKDPIGHPATELQLKKIEKIIGLVHQYPIGRVVLLAGDRDWNASRRGGQKNVNQLEKAIKKIIRNNDFNRAKWAFAKACPTPKVYEIDESLLLITINTQWWNHPFDKPRAADADCAVITHDDFIEGLEDEVSENQDKNILIVGHHPFESVEKKPVSILLENNCCLR